MRQIPLAMRLRERAVFDSFVPGSNARVIAQLQSAACGAEPRVYWLYGPTGSGKSHLLQACCTRALEAAHAAAYLPLSALQEFGPDALQGWSEAALVALDELSAVLGRRDWEEALFALYRACEERGTTLIVAAAVPAAQLSFALPDLASRFASALPLALQALDERAQRQALQWRARARGLELPDQSARYLQRHFRRDLPTLCELLDTIDSAALQAQRRLTVPFIREVLALSSPRAG
ncbi:MAG TPA: DnaA regulatory inactivator Hda [Steroidobacteraceae bacterium]|jgi:DnaA family protein|nr:DnaA regulatory inactivator Hda [Steroidobacteraceae bacterium]